MQYHHNSRHPTILLQYLGCLSICRGELGSISVHANSSDIVNCQRMLARPAPSGCQRYMRYVAQTFRTGCSPFSMGCEKIWVIILLARSSAKLRLAQPARASHITVLPPACHSRPRPVVSQLGFVHLPSYSVKHSAAALDTGTSCECVQQVDQKLVVSGS